MHFGVLFSFFFFFVACIILLKALMCFLKNRKLQQENNIPKGTIFYSDLNNCGKPLFSKKYNITGKPDCIVKTRHHLIPVEFKLGIHQRPLYAHSLQLAAYCHLIEETYHRFVPYGMLIYQNQRFTIPFDPKLRYELDQVLQKIRTSETTGDLHRNHHDITRCKNCSLRIYCSEKLI
ncbi:MAG: CRISPR-associated protein Cas4 [Candidatus Thermoplasmatota archaeon]